MKSKVKISGSRRALLNLALAFCLTIASGLAGTLGKGTQFPIVSIATAAAAEPATQHALIVGVSEYPSLSDRDLRGPMNDAALVASTLGNWGFNPDNITILADGVEGAELPTRAAIIGAMQELVAESTRPGDFVYVHFSGHGSQQPAIGGGESQETDGYDEIFLPRDIGHWDDGKAAVENAIVDDEVASFVTQLRNKGVFVWLVFDSCHSGDMTRSIPVDDELDRRIDFLDLVAPGQMDSALAAENRATESLELSRGTAEPASFFAGEDIVADDDAAGFVAFFAAQTTETAPEFRLPAWGERQPHGLFTFTLMNLVQTQPGLTYRQLGQQALRSYEAIHRSRPTPLFVGSELDAPMFGSSTIERVEQYRLSVDGDVITVDAGALHDVSPGAVFAVVPQPGSPDTDVLGHIEVSSAEMSRSTAMTVAYNELGILDVDEIPASAYARPVQRTMSLSLRVALPADASASARITGQLAAAQESPSALVEWVPTGSSADLRLTVQDDRIWLVQPSGELCTASILSSGSTEGCRRLADITPSVNLDAPEWSKDLLENLSSVAKATNLLRLANSGGAGGSMGVILSMEVRRGAGQPFETVPVGQRPQVRPGDRVRFRLKNESERAQDVTVLFVDSRWGIDTIYPGRRGERNRIEAGGSYVIGGANGFGVNADTTGLERIVMIAVPGEASAMIADFSFLQQPALVATRNLDQAGPAGFRGLLETAGFNGGRTRGLTDDAQDETSIETLSWETVPADSDR